MVLLVLNNLCDIKYYQQPTTNNQQQDDQTFFESKGLRSLGKIKKGNKKFVTTSTNNNNKTTIIGVKRDIPSFLFVKFCENVSDKFLFFFILVNYFIKYIFFLQNK